MSRILVRLVSFSGIVALLSSCSTGRGSGEPAPGTAGVVIAVETVPTDVSCLAVMVTATATTTQSFNVTPNQPATVTVQGLPAGPASISEEAFGVPCSQVTAMTTPTWVSTAPALVTLVAGGVVDVSIVLRRPAQVQISTGFDDGTASFNVTPSPIAVGNVAVGSGGAVVATITNTSGVTQPAPTLSITGTDTAQFSLTTSSHLGLPPCVSTTTLAAGGACATIVQFSPTSGGSKTAALVVTGGSGVVDATVPVSGTGTTSPTTFTASPNPITFPAIVVGSGATNVVTVTNTGPLTAPVPGLSIAGPDAAQFSLVASAFTSNPPCTALTSLASGAACVMEVAFSPTSAGGKAASFVMSDSSGTAFASVPITGAGGVATFSLTPTAIAVGTVGVGSSGQSVATVTNTSTFPGATPVLAITGTDASQFSLRTSASISSPPCTALTSLAAGSTCAMVVDFSPTSGGGKAASLVMTDSHGVVLASIPLTGTGGVAAFSLSPVAIAFGSVGVGSSGQSAATVTNTTAFAGATPVLSITGTDATQFSLQTSASMGNIPCTALTSLSGGSACAMLVAFSPTSGGGKAASLVMSDSHGVVLASIPLTGTGGVAAFSASPAALAFGTVGVGSNAQLVATLTNTSAFAGAPPALSITGSDAAQFSLQTSPNSGLPPCAALTSLGAGAACTGLIVFSPTSGGAKAATLIVTGSGGAVATTVPLTGTGGVAAFSASPNPIAFGNLGVGSASTIVVTISNTSAFAGPPPALSLTGTSAAEFSLQTSASLGIPACASLSSVPGGTACSTVVRFAPTVAGAKAAMLMLGTGGPTVPISGNGLGAPTSVSVSPSPVNFGSVGNGGSATVIVTVTNTGTSLAAPPSFTVSGTNANQFAIQTPTATGNPACAGLTSLSAGSACTTQIRFTPTSTGAKTATLNVAGAVATVSLTGSGV
jgi:trimeric autotransporter adhesin